MALGKNCYFVSWNVTYVGFPCIIFHLSNSVTFKEPQLRLPKYIVISNYLFLLWRYGGSLLYTLFKCGFANCLASWKRTIYNKDRPFVRFVRIFKSKHFSATERNSLKSLVNRHRTSQNTPKLWLWKSWFFNLHFHLFEKQFRGKTFARLSGLIQNSGKKQKGKLTFKKFACHLKTSSTIKFLFYFPTQLINWRLVFTLNLVLENSNVTNQSMFLSSDVFSLRPTIPTIQLAEECSTKWFEDIFIFTLDYYHLGFTYLCKSWMSFWGNTWLRIVLTQNKSNWLGRDVDIGLGPMVCLVTYLLALCFNTHDSNHLRLCFLPFDDDNKTHVFNFLTINNSISSK